jgi:hypothetical protein
MNNRSALRAVRSPAVWAIGTILLSSLGCSSSDDGGARSVTGGSIGSSDEQATASTRAALETDHRASYVPDCNDPEAHSVACAEPTRALIDQLHAQGYPYYIGHDEPKVLFFSNTGASGNNMRWKFSLPATDPAPTQDGAHVNNFELFDAQWIGLALCNPQSFPFGPCTPNSDTNSPTAAGSAFLELQFFTPTQCGTGWCVSMNVFSFEQNSNCVEPVSSARLSANGTVGGPELIMATGDTLEVTLQDTTQGLQTTVHDLTSGQTGFMVASAANGFTQTNHTTCVTSPFDFHPMYATAAPGQGVTWTQHTPNVSFSFEIGHFELCHDTTCASLPDNDTDDIGCNTFGGVGGCTAPDLDQDGLSYQADWPDGTSAHPASYVIGAPNDQGAGPMSAATVSGATYDEGYAQLMFRTLQTPSGAFYPFFSQAGSGAACRFNFGNDIPGVTTNDFAKAAQYSGADVAIANPCDPSGSALTIAPVADAYVRDGTSANTNFGTATTLVVKDSATTGNNRIGFLRFPVDAVGAAVSSAKLRIFGSRPAASSLTDSAFAVSDNTWSETGITWNNRPALGAKQGSGVVITTTGQYFEWDVTSFVQAQKTAGVVAVSLAVRMDATTTASPDTFNSREASANPPQLVVASGAGDNPPTVATPAAANPNPVSGTTTALSVLGADSQGESTLTYTWSAGATPPAAVAFSPNGTNAAKNSTATFSGAGTYSLQVVIQNTSGQTAVSSVTVNVTQTLAAIAVSPPTATVQEGGTQQFTATAMDQFGGAITPAPTFTWSVSCGGTISSTGLFTAGGVPAGPCTVTAASGGVTGTAAVTVASTSVTTLGPVADAYVRDGTSANTNFGTATTLLVKSASTAGTNRHSFLRFDTTPAAGSVQKATLRLFGNHSTGTTLDSAWAVSSNTWTETGITWNNQPALGAKQGGSVSITTTAMYYEFDVTAFVQSQRSAGVNLVSLAVTMDAPTTNAPDTFNSREAASNPPQLMVTSN